MNDRKEHIEDIEYEKELRKDVDFLKIHIKESLKGPMFASARNYVERIQKKQTLEGQLAQFGSFPINKHIFKLELNNPNSLSKTTILKCLEEWCKPKIDASRETCREMQTAIRIASEQLEKYAQNSEPEKVTVDSVHDYVSCLKTYTELAEARASAALKLIAYTIIPFGKIIKNNIYYDTIMDPIMLDCYLGGYQIERRSGVSMEEINEKVKEILTKIDFFLDEKDKLSFSFNSVLTVKGKFAILEVSYNHFPAAQKYFEKNFLQIYASNQEALCQELAQEMKTFRSSYELMEKFWKREDPPVLEALISSAERYFRIENERLEAEKLKLKFIRETPKQERVNDIIGMVCEVQFIQQYCSECHNTTHSLSECTT